MPELLAICLGSYLIGSIPWSVIVCALFGRSNPLRAGSNNPGATNVARLHGKGLGALTLALDAAKGVAAVYAALLLSGSGPQASLAPALSLFLVNLGHAKSPFLRFGGGKCVASGLGSLATGAPWLGLGAALVWLATFALWRSSALSAVTAFALLVPLMAALVYLPSDGLEMAPEMMLAIAALSALVLLRHRSNYGEIANTLKQWRAARMP